jgi:hypothetical protein
MVDFARKCDEISILLPSPNARANAVDEEKSRACTLVCITAVPCDCLCAEQKNFAQLALREGVKRPKSIKKSESAVSDSRRARLDAGKFLRDAAGAIVSAADQSPSFFFKSSLTACGLALPPDDFIT